MEKEKIEVIAYWLMGKSLCNEVINDYKNIDTIIKAVKKIENAKIVKTVIHINGIKYAFFKYCFTLKSSILCIIIRDNILPAMSTIT